MLGKAIIVAGDGAGADVGPRAHTGIADVGEVIDLGPFLHRRLLHLNEIADLGARGDLRPGAQARERTNHGMRGDRGLLDVTVRPDHRALAHRHTGAEPHPGLNDHIRCKLCVKA